MESLISMVDFVCIEAELNRHDAVERMQNYASFLKQPLELWMFVPCKLVDGDWVVLELPGSAPIHTHSKEYEKEWRLAKERCLFEGFELIENHEYCFKLQISFDNFHETIDLVTDETIEDLLTYSVNFDWELTSSALKQIGL